jgi:hypothetical protein
MSLVIRFSQYGQTIEIASRPHDSFNQMPETVQRATQLVDNSQVPSYLTCFLISRCVGPCTHRSIESIEFLLEDDSAAWLVELLVTVLRCGDALARRRAATYWG